MNGPDEQTELPINPTEGASEDGQENLDGTITRITYRNEQNGYTVATLDLDQEARSVTIVGILAGIEMGDTIRVHGQWTTDPRYGPQLKIDSSEVRIPTGRKGLIRFLGGGRIKGVGPKTAEKIVDTLGLDVLQRLERKPHLLSLVDGISSARSLSIAKQLEEHREESGSFVFLAELGLGPQLAHRVFKAYGTNTVAKVRENPYRVADEIHGIGFRIADQMAQSLGHEKDSAFRIAAGLRYLLGQAATQEGHVGLPPEALTEAAAAFLEVDTLNAESVLADMVTDSRLIEDELIYRPELHRHEVAVAQDLSRRASDPRPLTRLEGAAAVTRAESAAGVELAEDQRDAILTALRSRVSVITGGPGVGKTTLIRVLVHLLATEGLSVSLAAPTGRAARRLEEATGSNASTLHRLLGLLPSEDGFRSIREEPLSLDVLIVDEVSMVDISLMAAVVEALPENAGLICVGDVDQLPSVGPGEVLGDLIKSKRVPVGRLTTIFRQAEHSSIVRVAHELNDGQIPTFDEGREGQAFFVEKTQAEEALDAVLNMVSDRIPNAFELDAKKDVQVITPIHGGPLGTVALNEALRDTLNPPQEDRPEIERFGRLFRQGDKVMQVRNNYDLMVFNGDIGTLDFLDPDDGHMTVQFHNRKIDYSLDELDQLTPAYAITCHKSQGSEFPAVVMPLIAGHFVMLRRNLVYTAVTRAKSVLVMVGEPRALSIAASRPGSGQRHTALKDRLQLHDR